MCNGRAAKSTQKVQFNPPQSKQKVNWVQKEQLAATSAEIRSIQFMVQFSGLSATKVVRNLHLDVIDNHASLAHGCWSDLYCLILLLKKMSSPGQLAEVNFAVPNLFILCSVCLAFMTNLKVFYPKIYHLLLWTSKHCLIKLTCLGLHLKALSMIKDIYAGMILKCSNHIYDDSHLLI